MHDPRRGPATADEDEFGVFATLEWGADDWTELHRAAHAAQRAQRPPVDDGPLVIRPRRRRWTDGLLPRLVETLPLAGPVLVGVASGVWVYVLLVLVRSLVPG